ncbi:MULTISPECIES: hypothetical protein [unclassified Streptomyces]|jgi:enoyl-CoA hydratase/carnithine racemase|uniref:hypothetical protein n=1 Tax=unclassified Streptomyces TaxID=2593676 RepID=UPI00225A4B5F|nr:MULTISPECIES: hypothetical protein [unclassified Streptomyces]MCX4405378.1 hypothetical protein [Streptomyces sp. NBC_01764]MCX5190070.1 hypothetical protein [Streptomyces sp. NBC_00268]
METPQYFQTFPDFAFERTQSGVLTLRLHSAGEPALLSSRLHRDFPRVLRQIADDRANKVLVLTGTGDHFMTEMDLTEDRQAFKPLNWDEIFLPRAIELAEALAARPSLLLRLTPLALRQRLARRLEEGTTLGLALEGLSMADKPYQN